MVNASQVAYSSPSVQQVPFPSKSSYKRYSNHKYGYSFEYPSYLEGDGESDAHDGQRFRTKTNPLDVRVWASYSNWSGDEWTIQQEQADTVKNLASDDLPAPKITYKAEGKDWFVISGTTSNNIFYEKTIKAHGIFATVLLIYPFKRKAEFDPVVSRIVGSLKIR